MCIYCIHTCDVCVCVCVHTHNIRRFRSRCIYTSLDGSHRTHKRPHSGRLGVEGTSDLRIARRQNQRIAWVSKRSTSSILFGDSRESHATLPSKTKETGIEDRIHLCAACPERRSVSPRRPDCAARHPTCAPGLRRSVECPSHDMLILAASVAYGQVRSTPTG